MKYENREKVNQIFEKIDDWEDILKKAQNVESLILDPFQGSKVVFEKGSEILTECRLIIVNNCCIQIEALKKELEKL